MSASQWPLQVFFDGACPLCSREVRYYRKRDRYGHIAWIDIAQPGFCAGDFGLDGRRVQQVMHARAADGRVFTEVRAFVQIWEALPPSLPTTLLRWFFRVPGTLALGGVFYRLFAKNRYRLTGRCTPESCAVR